MSIRYPGGLITKTPVTPSTSSAAGIWTLEQALEYIKAGTWPTTSDPYFEYVTLLLHGNGTNGAQNNTFLDSSTNAFSVTRNGNTTQGSFSPFSRSNGYWSIYFDGVDDYLSIPNNAALQPGSGDFTVEFWAYNTDTAAAIDMYYASGASGISIYRTSAGKIEVAQDGVLALLTGATTIVLNQWNHIAVVRSGTTLRIYLNGVQDATTTNSTNFSSAGTQYIGTGSTSSYYWPGYLSNFRLVKGTAVYTGAFTPPTSPLTAITNTSLLTCQSNRFIDNSTNAFAITVNGNPSVQVFSPFNPTTAYSTTTNGGSGYFDGVGDTLTLSANAALQMDAGDFTVEMWHYCPLTTSQLMTLFATSDPNSSGSLCLFNESSNWTVRIGGLGSDLTVAVNASQRNAWVHVALVRNAGTLTLYLNGTSVVSGNRTQNVTQSIVNIGVLGGFGVNYTGYISNFRIVKGTAIYTANFTPPTSPVTAVSGTSLLLNFTNGGIFDNAAMNDLETVGNAQISTAQSKFGGGSMLFDGTDDYLVSPASVNYEVGTGNYTIEFWVYWNTVGNIAMLFGWNGGATGSTFAYTYSDGRIGIGIQGINEITSSSGQATTGSWIHMAFVKNGSTTTIYKNGTSIASNTTGVWSSNTGTATFSVGGGASSSDSNCYIDDFRITKGYARYTANFTPPTAPFPDK